MICAAEDVGMADPNALVVATAAAQAVERVGMPEARIILSEAAVYVATAPKSNASYLAIGDALRTVESQKSGAIPRHLQNKHADSYGMERDQGYLYAHDFENHYVDQQYLPYELKKEKFYIPGELGYENKITEHMKKIRGEE
jgi:putative ATPase